MAYDYDMIVIGMGPAGMAVSGMASEMGLKVCAIEKHRIGGECMNVGCIPSKSLLRIADYRSSPTKLHKMGLADLPKPDIGQPFDRIQQYLEFIRDKKTIKMFDKVQLVYQKGAASFVDPHTVKVVDERYSAKRIFICIGTRPEVPHFQGIEQVGYLTNENIFELEAVPESLIIVGGGAIACEMAQAFARLGSNVTIIIRGPRLMWREESDATDLIEKTFEAERINILREHKPIRFEKQDGQVVMHTDKERIVSAEKVMVAAGRQYEYSQLNLKNADIEIDERGAIKVDKFLRTTQRHIYAPGDCNGHYLFSHAAMHQGMIALMNCMLPRPFKIDFRKFPVPWTVFTEPQFSRVGLNEKELKAKGVEYEVVRTNYSDYGAAIAEGVEDGFIKAFVSKAGRIYGVYIIGENSGELINEWALAIQNKLRIHRILMQQHSFPTMGFLTKRIAEIWMMNRMKSNMLRKVCQWMYRF
jgi:pyruvate/2-oxoglutarate dehydrogenase complex dihydrolipoamide dehydrogenase (E3) component